jgi:hypothetical protein
MFSIKLLFIEKYLYYHKNDGSASIFGMMREERSLKFKFDTYKKKKFYKRFTLNRLVLTNNVQKNIYTVNLRY